MRTPIILSLAALVALAISLAGITANDHSVMVMGGIAQGAILAVAWMGRLS